MAFRATETVSFSDHTYPMDSVAIKAGEIACLNADGYLVPGSIATGLIAVGIANESVDNSAGDPGDLSCAVGMSHDNLGFRTFLLKNASGGDAVDQADVGKDCWIFNANTVSGTSNGGTRSRAGRVLGFWKTGEVMVYFDMAQVEISDLQSQVDAIEALAEAAPAMQPVNATLVAGTVTINTGITVAANSEVVAFPTGVITGSTNFAMVRELKASRVNGAPGVGTLVIEALGSDGAKDADAAGQVRVVIFTPQA
jgi:hypothetical protein